MSCEREGEEDGEGCLQEMHYRSLMVSLHIFKRDFGVGHNISTREANFLDGVCLNLPLPCNIGA